MLSMVAHLPVRQLVARDMRSSIMEGGQFILSQVGGRHAGQYLWKSEFKEEAECNVRGITSGHFSHPLSGI